MLLFDMENEDPAAFLSAHDTLAPGGVRTRRRYPGYMRPTRQPRERQKDLAFHYTKLGKSISFLTIHVKIHIF